MYKPNYHNGSIVNLMSSIARALDGKTEYNPLKILPPEKLKGFQNIVLLVVDGLGYSYLKNKDSILNDYLLASIDSVFLPTTACAITSFLTGVAPQQHANTGWFMHLKEFGCVSTILPFVPRYGEQSFNESGLYIRDVFNEKSFFEKIKAKSFIIQRQAIIDSDFSKYFSKGAKRISHKERDINGFFNEIVRVMKSKGNKKFIYAYWPYFDSVCHHKGIGSKESNRHFIIFEKKLRIFLNFIKGSNTLVLVTADHGFINTPEKRCLWLEEHPKLNECLSLPLSGEPRAVYCYLKLSREKDFLKYVKEKLGKYCDCYKSEEIIKQGYFGKGRINPKLYDRVGDYILVFKDNYIMKDKIMNEERTKHIGHHGGVSIDEMRVPLVAIGC